MFPFGACYYPEHWSEDRWPLDAQLMTQAGFNMVRMAEFAWSKLEPREGQFDFAWLNHALEILSGQGIRAILGTPTASPPPWLMAAHPELYRVREDGLPLTYGNRREYCPNHPLYAEYSRRIVTKMAEHYGGHPAVTGWQIDNEFGDRCYCPVCARAFQDWLFRHYGTLDRLNDAWGTVFWSHIYTSWDEIPLPLTTGGSPNPGLALDFARFASDSYVAYQHIQVEILREKCPGQFITHNLMGFGYDRLDYYDLARDLDFISWDNYPRNQWWTNADVDPAGPAIGHDNMRGLKRKNFWMMEQQAGPGGWEMVGMAPRPGELRLWAYQAIAHGADALIFFRWRTARFGTEEYWHGLLNHDGTPSRRYDEIRQMGAELQHIGSQIAGAEIRSKVAILLDYDTRFAFQIQPNNPQFSFYEYTLNVYRCFFQRNVMVDLVSPNDDLSGYRLVIAPALHIVRETDAANLLRFVEGGGTLLVTPRSGVKSETNTVVNQPLPGLLRVVCGVEVEEYDSLMPAMKNELEWLIDEKKGEISPVSVWCDILQPTSAEVMARYRQDFYTGKPAVTLNRQGKGQVVYAGVLGGTEFYDTLAGMLLEMAGVEPLLASTLGVEVTERWQGDRRLLFLLNHTVHPQVVKIEKEYVNLMNKTQIPAGEFSLPPRQVVILAEKTT